MCTYAPPFKILPSRASLSTHKAPSFSFHTKFLLVFLLPSLNSTGLVSSMEIGAENLCVTELRLGPPGSSGGGDQPTTKKPSSVGAKRALDDTKSEASGTGPAAGDDQDITAAAKAQVVGWPPVRAYRRNTFQAAAKKAEQQQGGLYVKVSMDGAPYLRKVDLRMYKGYRELREALDVLFIKCFSASAAGVHAADSGCGDQFAIAYEDKDGDLMLVGDVPWEMFISSCKKLRIMKGSEAR